MLLKKIVSALLYPVGAISLLLLLALLVAPRRPQLARAAVGCALLLLVTASLPPVAGLLVGGLEGEFSALDAGSTAVPDVILVLSAGRDAVPARSALEQLSDDTLRRTLEGVRLARAWPQARLLLSGGPSPGPSDAAAMAAVARELGVDAARLWLDEESADTHEQALFAALALAGSRTVVVTSAYHMPRTMALFRTAGVDAVPAPAGPRSDPGPLEAPLGYLPSARALASTTVALHEYVGIAWSTLRGQIDPDVLELPVRARAARTMAGVDWRTGRDSNPGPPGS